MKTAFHKIKVAFLAVLLSLGMNSCQDWLTIFPEGELILEDYWKEECSCGAGGGVLLPLFDRAGLYRTHVGLGRSPFR